MEQFRCFFHWIMAPAITCSALLQSQMPEASPSSDVRRLAAVLEARDANLPIIRIPFRRFEIRLDNPDNESWIHSNDANEVLRVTKSRTDGVPSAACVWTKDQTRVSSQQFLSVPGGGAEVTIVVTSPGMVRFVSKPHGMEKLQTRLTKARKLRIGEIIERSCGAPTFILRSLVIDPFCRILWTGSETWVGANF